MDEAEKMTSALRNKRSRILKSMHLKEHFKKSDS